MIQAIIPIDSGVRLGHAMIALPQGGGVMKVLLSSDQIQSRILEMGKQIAADYKGGEPHLVGVLKGACPFMTDLAQAIDLPLTLDYIAVSSYGKATKSSGEVKLVKDLDQGLDGRDLVVVEDIVDTGLTLNFLRTEIERRRPASISVVTLVDRPVRRLLPVRVDYVGLEVPDVFVIGYGLDFAGRYRNLHGLWGADGLALAAEPDLHVMELYAPGP
jgi:hypoxanthine phosphoribosyltransferase